MKRWGMGLVAALGIVMAPVAAVELQPAAKTACNDLLPAAREVKGRKVGPTSCEMVESQVAVAGKQIVRLDIGLDGTAEGYVTKAGEYRGYMTNSPELAFAQTADPGEPVLAFADYRRAQGAAMSLFFPQDPAAWNGRVWVMAHGAGPGTDRSWDAGLAGNAARGAGAYPEELLARGFAVAVTRRAANAVALGRNASPPPTGVQAVLEDGTNGRLRRLQRFGDLHQGLHRRRRQVPRAPAQAPAYTTLLLWPLRRRANWPRHELHGWPESTRRRQAVLRRLLCRRLSRGHLAAGGDEEWQRRAVHDRRRTRGDGAAVRGRPPGLQQHLADETARLGVGELSREQASATRRSCRTRVCRAKFRMYEVRGISHAGSGPGLTIAPMWGQFFAMFDAWVDMAVAPPPSRSDVADIGDADRDGRIENPAIAFPQLACPMGVYYTTTTTSTSIAFAPYTGSGLEPLNEEKIFVDMNRNGVWDRRESLQQAWLRLGLLKPDETITRERSVACVQQSAEALRRDGFFSEKTAAEYIDHAKKTTCSRRRFDGRISDDRSTRS